MAATAASARPSFRLTSSSSSAVALGSMVERSGEDFQKTLQAAGDTTVVVDFYAEMLSPILSKAVASNGKTFVVKLNVDDNPNIASQYEIMSLPTVAAFKNGKIVDSFIGLRNEAAVVSFIDNVTK
ncbi:thioredoxin 2 [Cladochytrium tenue]|nr:thioredoxin 2 [Cladochytrium tenue]